MRAIRPSALIWLMAAALLAFSTGAAEAHGNPQITLSPNPAPARATVTIAAVGFEEEDHISLSLEGISASLHLGTAMTDAKGSFHMEVTLPEAAVPGAYRIRAEGSDATALADLRITAAGQPSPLEHERAIDFHRGGPAAEGIALGVTMAVFALAGLALALGHERAPR